LLLVPALISPFRHAATRNNIQPDTDSKMSGRLRDYPIVRDLEWKSPGQVSPPEHA
jgi:hypothetical protein